jgi:hypothetical protein
MVPEDSGTGTQEAQTKAQKAQDFGRAPMIAKLSAIVRQNLNLKGSGHEGGHHATLQKTTA